MYVNEVWFVIRILCMNNFNEVTSADITEDILRNSTGYQFTYNITGKDEIYLSKDLLPHSYVSARICGNIKHIAKHILNEIVKRDIHVNCPDNIYVCLDFNFVQHRHVVNPEQEIARVLTYLRASLHNKDRYKIDNFHSNTYTYDIVDWVSRHVCDAQNDNDIYVIWFATRLLILNNFKPVTMKNVEQAYGCNDNCRRIESFANEICNDCHTYGGVFKYDNSIKLPYYLENCSNKYMIIIGLLVVLVIVLTIMLLI